MSKSLMYNPFVQLALPLRFDRSCSFENFYSTDQFSVLTLSHNLAAKEEPLVVVKGDKSTGKSHLLSSAALFCQSHKIPFQYFDADMLLSYEPDIIAFCEKGHVLIIDDIHLLVNNEQWERKLYDLYNDAQRHQWLLVVSCLSSQSDAFCLKDWQSRMKAGIQIGLSVADEDVSHIIQFRANLLGLKVKPDAVEYLLNHYSRDTTHQLNLIKRLDDVSLAQNRNITIPFIKQVLEA